MSLVPENVKLGEVASPPLLKPSELAQSGGAQPVRPNPLHQTAMNVLVNQPAIKEGQTLLKEALKKLNLTEQEEQDFKTHLKSALKPDEENIEELFKQLKMRTEIQKVVGTNENLIESLLDVEQGDSHTTQLTLASVKETEEFSRLIGALLPPIIKDKHVSPDKIEKFEKLSAILLGAIHQGSEGVALIARNNLLKEHKELITGIKQKIKKSGHSLSGNDLKELKKTLDEMIKRVKIEENVINGRLLSITGLSKLGLAIGTFPLDYFPRFLLPSDEVILISREVLKGIGWGLKTVEIPLLTVDLALKYKAQSTLKKWNANFEEESVRNEPRVVIGESKEGGDKFTTRRVIGEIEKLKVKKRTDFNDFIDFVGASPLSKKMVERSEIEKKLHDTIEKATSMKAMHEIFAYLRKTIPTGLETCEAIKSYFAAHPNEWKGLVDAFLERRESYQGYKALAADSKNLLQKRENQTRRQVEEFLPLFPKMKEKVEKVAKEGFDRRIDGLIEKISPTENRKLSGMLEGLEGAIKTGIIKKRTPLYEKFLEGKKLSRKKAPSKRAIAEFRVTLLATIKATREQNPKQITRALDAFLDQLVGTPSLRNEEGFDANGVPTRGGAAILDAVSKLIEEGVFQKDSEIHKTFAAIGVKDANGNPNRPSDHQLFNQLKAAILKLKNDGSGREELFSQWYGKKTTEKKLSDYIDHQNVLDSALKNSLRTMVKNKQTIEKKFLDFTAKSSTINYIGSVTIFAVSATFAILALIGNPVAGAAMILFCLAIGTTVTSLALTGASYAMAFKLRPKITAAFFKADALVLGLRQNLELGFKKFRLNSKQKSLYNTAKSIQALLKSKKQSPDVYEKLIKAFREKKADIDQRKAKIADLERKVDALVKKSNQKAWEDFSKVAGFDGSDSEQAYLASLAKGLEGLDESFASEEIKRLLRVQLALGSMGKEADEIKEELRKFFAQDDKEIVSFIRRQTNRLEKKLIS